MEKLLVVGIDTPIGANVALAASSRCRVLGVSLQHHLDLDGIDCEHVRGHDAGTVNQLAADFHPSSILHCGPLSASSWDLAMVDPAWEHEPLFVQQLSDRARSLDARLTVVLTDAEFAGPHMFHEETSATDSKHPATAHALAVRQLLADTAALVVRTHAYGWAPAATEPVLAERIWQALSAGTGISPDGHRYATPILASDLADLLFRAWQLDLRGLLHLTGAERTSPFRLACEMAAAFGLPAPRSPLTATEHDDKPHVDGPAQISETSLSSRRARRSLDTPMPMLREGLQRFAQQAHSGWRERSRLIEHSPQRQNAA